MKDVYIINVMSTPVRTVSHDDTVTKAAEVMEEFSIGSVIVTNQGDPEGILTEGDIVETVATGRCPDDTHTEEVEGSPLLTCSASDPIDCAAEKMIKNGIKKVPVMHDDGEEVVGIVTTTDIAQYVPHHFFH